MSADRPPVVGIIGGIGSGKTSVADALSRFLKSRRIDADAAGHTALTIPHVQEQLRSAFGDEIFDSSGNVLRSALARRVFGEDDQQRDARQQLESIVHPVIRDLLVEELGKIQQSRCCDVVLLDAAVLLEAGWGEVCDAVVFIAVPEPERLRRVQLRGWTEDEFRRREASQMDVVEKSRRADKVIDNSQGLEAAAQDLADWIIERFHIPIQD